MRRPQCDKFAGFLVGPGVHGAPRRSWRPQRRTMHSLIASAFWRLHLFHSGVDSEPLATMRRLITGPHPGRMACQQPQRGVSPKELSCQTIFKRYAWRLDRKRQQNSNCHGFTDSTEYLLPAKFLAAWKACFLVILIEIARRRASSSKTNFLTIEPSSDRTSKQSWCWMILIAPIKAALRGPFGKSPHGIEGDCSGPSRHGEGRTVPEPRPARNGSLVWSADVPDFDDRNKPPASYRSGGLSFSCS